MYFFKIHLLPFYCLKDINKGTIIDLDKNAFEPITIYVDGKEFAKGEVVVRRKNNNFSLRVTELL